MKNWKNRTEGEFLIIRKFIQAIISVIFPQKWQFRLKIENFEISRNSAYLWPKTITKGREIIFSKSSDFHGHASYGFIIRNFIWAKDRKIFCIDILIFVYLDVKSKLNKIFLGTARWEWSRQRKLLDARFKLWKNVW